VVVRAAGLLDQHLGTIVHSAVLRLSLQTRQVGEAHQPVRDLDQIRTFLTSQGPIAIVDMPWMPVFMFVCYLVHPWLGFLSLGGGLLLVAITLLTERASRIPARDVAQGASQRSTMVEGDRRNSETIKAMGLGGALSRRWTTLNETYLAAVEPIW
jgi:ATP-binding cassette subfamily C protein